MEIPMINNYSYAYFYSKDEALRKGYEPAFCGGKYYMKISQIKGYSKLCKPQRFSSSKYNDYKYQTHYYMVKKSEFDKLTEKPELEEITRPMELTNYDWYHADVSAEEKNGFGWVEQYKDECGINHNNYFFIVNDF